MIVNLQAAEDDASLKAAAEDPARRTEIARGELRRVAGPALDELDSKPDGKRFISELNASQGLLGDLMFSGPLPEEPGRMLWVLYEIWKADRAGLSDPHERSTAAAVALTFAKKGWPEDKALVRYEYFRDSRKQGLLHPQFDELQTWEKRFVVSAGSNGGWGGAGGWDDASLAWLRDNVKLPAKDYVGACWQAPYRLDNLFGDSIHGSMYYAPFGDQIHAKRVRDVGGVCGSLSHYGATAARANGIPAITMGEPGHCAYAVRVARGEWTPAYSLSWQRGLHTSLWGNTWTQLVLQEKALGEKYDHDRCTAHLYQARSLAKSNPELAETAYRLALEAQPVNQPAWLEATAFLRDVRKPEAAAWQAIQKGLLGALATYPEAAWGVISGFQKAALEGLSGDKRQEFLLEFHKAIANQDGPVMWDYESALEAQSLALGGDIDRQLAFFEQVLAIQAGSKSWFAPTIAWGQKKFGKDSGTANAYFNALAKVFSSSSAGANKDGLRAALRPAVIAAEASGNVEAFQSLGQAGASLRGGESIKTEPFPGDLLTSGGLLTTSSTCGWDHPENHWGVIESCGGGFHTDSQVRPLAIVRLGKLGDLTGVVIHDSSGGQNAARQLPLKVSVSEDGQTWTQIFRTDKHESMWRIPLEGKATRVQFIKVERDDDRKEFFHLNAIHAYGRRLQ